MQTSFHFNSAQDINNEVIDKIKSTYDTKSITITVEDNTDTYSLSVEQKNLLDNRVNENTADYISASESINRLKLLQLSKDLN
jgi:hypothetical protein